MFPRVDLYEELSTLLNQIPPGKVSTCTMLAEALGDPLSARAIPEMLRELSGLDVPTHRVVHADGSMILPGAENKLAAEGVSILEGRVEDVERRLFREFKSRRVLALLRNIQAEIASKVVLKDTFSRPIRHVAGVDVSYRGRTAYGACVLWSVEDSSVVECSTSVVEVSFPYIPTYLSFREGPAMVEAVKSLAGGFDVLLVNGHGIAHPRRCGIASHIGVLLDVPSIGVARGLLPGFRESEDAEAVWRPVKYGGSVVGFSLKPGGVSKPVYVSPGHRVSLKTSVEIVLRCLRGHRLPEPLRLAHGLASRLRKALDRL